MEGGDCVDADSNPLSTITHWQKTQISGPECAARPRLISVNFRIASSTDAAFYQ
jgi:hypothetical protein